MMRGAILFAGLVFVAWYLLFQSDEYILSTGTVSESHTITDPVLDISAYGVYDLRTGKALLGVRTDEVVPIASITKLITASAAYAAADIQATTTIGWQILDTEGVSGRLRYGDTLSRYQLLFPLLLESSNDAATALYGADRMLEIADYIVSLRLTQTKLQDASGLSDAGVSTVADLAMLVRYMYQQQSHLLDITKLSHYVTDTHAWRNNSPFIGMQGYYAGKHGFTPAAGATAAVIFEEGEELILYIVLGSENVTQDVALLRAAYHY